MHHLSHVGHAKKNLASATPSPNQCAPAGCRLLTRKSFGKHKQHCLKGAQWFAFAVHLTPIASGIRSSELERNSDLHQMPGEQFCKISSAAVEQKLFVRGPNNIYAWHNDARHPVVMLVKKSGTVSQWPVTNKNLTICAIILDNFLVFQLIRCPQGAEPPKTPKTPILGNCPL